MAEMLKIPDWGRWKVSRGSWKVFGGRLYLSGELGKVLELDMPFSLGQLDLIRLGLVNSFY